jgi:glycogen debranching enzyme
LEKHFSEGCLGQISEIYDGSVPQYERGCFAQAWSVGQIMQMLCEEVSLREVEPSKEVVA